MERIRGISPSVPRAGRFAQSRWIVPGLVVSAIALLGCAGNGGMRVHPGVLPPPTPAGGATIDPPSATAPVETERRPFTVKLEGTRVAIEMKPIPGGEYTYEDPTQPGVRKTVTIPPMYVAATELTWDAFDIYVYRLDQEEEGADVVTRPSKPYVPPHRGYGHDGYPAIGMSYKNAEQFCKWLSEKTGRTFRLPTEIEWEYAARAGSDRVPSPDEVLDDLAWHYDNAGFKTNPVGRRKPNAWGLYDMLGNTAEWCLGVDGQPVARGGSWDDDPEDVHCRRRQPNDPMWNASDPQIPKSQWWLADCGFVGFRIVLAPDEQKKTESEASQKDEARP